MQVAKIGRPRKLELKQLQAFMRLNPSLEDTAAFFDCSVSTVVSFMTEMGTSFSQFREKNVVFTRRKLVRKAIDEALKGNTAMLIFCLKNLCDWRDRPPQEDFESLFSKMSRMELLNFLIAKFPELELKVIEQTPKQIEAPK